MTTTTQGNPWLYVGRHRADKPQLTRLPHHPFMPRHCAGTLCLHNHGDEIRPRMTIWKRRAA